jgi:predicted dienelactone hydrolase
MRALFLVAAIFLACIATQARASNALSLPSPSGPAAIGSVSLHLVDDGRWDSLAPARVRRSLMVTLWYPAQPGRPSPVPYLDAGAARVVDGEMDVAAGTFESVRSQARDAAPVAVPGRRGYPVVIYSPGFGSWRNAATAVTEDLVSHGFVVVAVDHPYDGAAVEFPDGTIVKTKPIAAPGNGDVITYDAWYAMVEPLLRVRVADVRFVLDELAAIDAGKNPDAEGRPLPPNLAGALDLRRIGMFGHSLGGTTMAEVMRTDSRIRAGLSLDGPIPGGETCIAQPVVQMRSVDPAIVRLTAGSWSSAARTLCGWHLATTLDGSGHNDFTDLTVFADQLALSPDRRAAWSLGSIGATQAVDAVRAHVLKFFERWLQFQS